MFMAFRILERLLVSKATGLQQGPAHLQGNRSVTGPISKVTGPNLKATGLQQGPAHLQENRPATGSHPLQGNTPATGSCPSPKQQACNRVLPIHVCVVQGALLLSLNLLFQTEAAEGWRRMTDCSTSVCSNNLTTSQKLAHHTHRVSLRNLKKGAVAMPSVVRHPELRGRGVQGHAPLGKF